MNKSARNLQGVGFEFGTRPHGLSADEPGANQETRGQVACLFLADQQAEGAQAFCPCFKPAGGEANGIERAATADQNAEASDVPKLLPYHYLELTDCEFLHLLSAVSRDRNDMRKAITKGKAVEADMEGTATLWEKLQEVRAIREAGYLRMYQRGAL